MCVVCCIVVYYVGVYCIVVFRYAYVVAFCCVYCCLFCGVRVVNCCVRFVVVGWCWFGSCYLVCIVVCVDVVYSVLFVVLRCCLFHLLGVYVRLRCDCCIVYYT